MNDIEFKFKELLEKKTKILNALDNNIFGAELLLQFKEFCNLCFSLKDWANLNLSDLSSSTYIDICRGVNNGDKHYKITNHLNSYKSSFYRTSVNGDAPTIQSSTGGYIGDDTSPLYTDPGYDKLVVETDTGTYGIKNIIIESVNDWENILKSNNLI